MSAIGYVTREGDSFKGQLRTLTIRAAIEITPNPSKANDSHPDYRVSSEGFVVTPTGTRAPWQGIDLTSLFAFSTIAIPSDMPSVHWDYLGLDEPVGEPYGVYDGISGLTVISSRTDLRAIGG